MLILGHTGITLGTAMILDAALNKKHSKQTPPSSTQPDISSRPSRFSALAKHIDIRVLLVGSLLPDIIDKPLGRLFFRDMFSNGRIICHTLFFLIILSLAGIYLYRRKRKNWLLVLSFGTFTHLIFDQMWLSPHTLFWPLYGWSFPKHANIGFACWLGGIFTSLLTQPNSYVYITEIIGGVVLGFFLWHIMKEKTLLNFITKGKVD